MSTPISAKVIAHSKIQGYPKELISLELEYPRFILSELNTHRVFSKSTASSRAIPVSKLIEKVINQPVRPLRLMANQPGMQSTTFLSSEDEEKAVAIWNKSAASAAYFAKQLVDLNVHKQFANRLLEPFLSVKTILTSTEWSNFFELRDHPDAQPEFGALAAAIRVAINESKPVIRERVTPEYSMSDESFWHLCYVTENERRLFAKQPDILLKLSTARCARVSYLNHDKENPSIEADLATYEKLVGSRPLHASPAEHQAFGYLRDSSSAKPTLYKDSNLASPWYQYRKYIEDKLK